MGSEMCIRDRKNCIDDNVLLRRQRSLVFDDQSSLFRLSIDNSAKINNRVISSDDGLAKGADDRK